MIFAVSPITNCIIKFLKITGVEITLPLGSIESDHISSTSGKEIVASKVHHRHMKETDFGLKTTDAPTAQTRWLHTARGAETIVGWYAQLYDTGTSTDVDFILKKNGSTLQATDLTIVHGDTDGAVVDGLATLSGVSLVEGDKLTVTTVVNASTGALGPRCVLEIDSVGE